MKKFYLTCMCVFILAGLAACEQEQSNANDADSAAKNGAPKPGLVMYNCGEMGIKAFFEEQAISLTAGEQNYTLYRVESASGVKYQNNIEQGVGAEIDLDEPSEKDVTFWTKGETALLTLGEDDYRECRKIEAHRAMPKDYRASGTEPFWSVEFNVDHITIDIMDRDPVLFERPIPKVTGEDHIYLLEGDNKITITPAPYNKPCSDGMSNRFYPEAVELIYEDKTYNGCGGI